MSGTSTGRFADADEYKSSLSDIFTEFIVTGRGDFDARVQRTDLHYLHLLQAQESLARAAYVTLPPDRVVISFTADPKRPLIWRGVELESDEIMLHACGEHLHQRTNGPSRWGLIALPPAALAAFCQTETGRHLLLPKIGQAIRPPPSQRKWLLRVHQQAARLAETRPAVVTHPEVVRAMELELVGVLVRCLTEGTVRALPGRALLAANVMERLEAALANSTRTDLTAAELSATVRVSAQTLHRHCLAFLGTSLRRYLQLRRLASARAAIRCADTRTARIGELARSFGFAEPGRFAILYKAVYGETPVATLRRLREVSPASEIT
jgi:AraC-like DNA-binding protein